MNGASFNWFFPATTNDFALLKLAQEIDLTATPNVKAACWPSFDPVPGDNNGMLSGWGRNDSSNTLIIIPDQLQMALVDILPDSTCQNVWGPGCMVNTTGNALNCSLWDVNQLCTSNSDSEGVCNGDSGGPLAVETDHGIWEVWGVTSYGNPYCCGCAEWPAVFSVINGVLDWIEDVTGGPCSRY